MGSRCILAGLVISGSACVSIRLTRPSHNQAVFAFRLARAETGNTIAAYSQAGSRSALALDPEFAGAFLRAKARIRNMELRYVEAADPLRQALLEIYVAVVLNTEHNDFETH
jgi:hypothetical protein